jgi:N-acetylglutamate synthase-like GNAT family acetyltransferase
MYMLDAPVLPGVHISRGFHPNEAPLARQIHEFGLKEIYLKARTPAADARLEDLIASRDERDAAFSAANASFVARIGNQMVGFIAIDSTIGERRIRGISVMKDGDFRGHNIGTALMKKCIKDASPSAMISVEFDEFTAVHAGFFKRFGFQAAPPTKQAAGNRLILPSMLASFY